MDCTNTVCYKSQTPCKFSDIRFQKQFLLVLVSSFENVKSSNNVIKHNVCVYIYIHMKNLRDKNWHLRLDLKKKKNEFVDFTRKSKIKQIHSI